MSDVINALILQTQQSMKTTGVVVTHDMKTVTKVANRVVMLYPLLALAPRRTADSVRRPTGGSGSESSATPRVGQFVRGEAGERLREMALHRSRGTASGKARVAQSRQDPRPARIIRG